MINSLIIPARGAIVYCCVVFSGIYVGDLSCVLSFSMLCWGLQQLAVQENPGALGSFVVYNGYKEALEKSLREEFARKLDGVRNAVGGSRLRNCKEYTRRICEKMFTPDFTMSVLNEAQSLCVGVVVASEISCVFSSLVVWTSISC